MAVTDPVPKAKSFSSPVMLVCMCTTLLLSCLFVCLLFVSGLFENYLLVKFRDPNLEAVSANMNILCTCTFVAQASVRDSSIQVDLGREPPIGVVCVQAN